MDMGFLKIFDAIIGILGLYLIFIGIKSSRAGIVDPMIITVEEQQRCKDIQGLSSYLMPKTTIFGVFCVIFGIQGGLNDLGIVKFPYVVNVGFLVLFLVVWGVFSFVIRKAKKTYLGGM